jgi:PAS domain S-box-containing protein
MPDRPEPTHLSISPDVEATIADQAASGRFGSTNAVLRAALPLLGGDPRIDAGAPPAEHPTGEGFLAGGGEMGALTRAFDWAATPLGAPGVWPQPLRTAVRLLLNTGHPMFIWWGPQLIQFYNDAYRRTMGPERHPSALGQPGRECWAEIWDIIGREIDDVMRHGASVWHEDQLVPVTRHGRREDVWWTYGYSPIDDPSAPSGVGGVLVVCNDVTREHLAREAQRDAEARTRLALEAVDSVGAWDWDLQAGVVRTDVSFARLFGVDPDLARTGAPIEAFTRAIPPDDRARVEQAIAHSLASGEEYTAEFRLLGAGGAVRWVGSLGKPGPLIGGARLSFPGVVFDITDRKREELRRGALAELASRFGDLENSADISFVAGEILGRVLNVDRAGYGSIDREAETVTIERDWCAPGVATLAGTLRFRDFGSYIDDLKRGETVIFADAEADPRTRATAAALKSVGAQAAINMPITEQGGVVAILYVNHATPRPWTADELDFIREVAQRTRTAAARRRAETELRKLNASLKGQVAERTRERDRLWRMSQDLLVVAESDGTIIDINDAAWTRLLGWRKEELVGFRFVDFAHPGDVAATREAFVGVVGAPLIRPYEYRFRHKDGCYRWFAWTAAFEDGRVYANGRHTTAEHEQADMLRRTEEQLRQAQKMEAVGQLTGGLAHDFNNLLTGIIGSLEVMQSRLGQGRLGELDRYITAAQGASRRAATLTHRLLAFSRRQTLDPKPTNVNRLVAGMEELIRRTVGPAIEIEVVGAAGLWTTLIDPSQLESALLNLCINSRDAMPEGGRITIETANTWLDDRAGRERDLPAGQYISLCVTDTGTGMTPEVIARAFDPFYTTKPLGQGTGLGLSMVYGFARQSGGQVRIYSEIGQGSTVCLYLPRREGQEEDADASAELAAASRAEQGESVLVVDDEPTVRMLVAEVLEELGYQAIEAADAPAGLRVLQSDARIDLLVTDVGLPGGMNGRQLAEAGRAHRPDMKILFITGYAENAVVGNGHLESGMHVLTKPFAMDVLADRIRMLVGR